MWPSLFLLLLPELHFPLPRLRMRITITTYFHFLSLLLYYFQNLWKIAKISIRFHAKIMVWYEILSKLLPTGFSLFLKKMLDQHATVKVSGNVHAWFRPFTGTPCCRSYVKPNKYFSLLNKHDDGKNIQLTIPKEEKTTVAVKLLFSRVAVQLSECLHKLKTHTTTHTGLGGPSIRVKRRESRSPRVAVPALKLQALL